jgi:hypothetical protein
MPYTVQKILLANDQFHVIAGTFSSNNVKSKWMNRCTLVNEHNHRQLSQYENNGAKS